MSLKTQPLNSNYNKSLGLKTFFLSLSPLGAVKAPTHEGGWAPGVKPPGAEGVVCVSAKSKPKTPKAVQINTILPLDIQRKVVVRYGVNAGISLLKRAKMEKVKDILAAERRVSSEINTIISKVLEGKMERSEAIKRLNQLKQKLSELKEQYAKLAAPYNAKIRPLRNTLKALDEEITSALKNLGLLNVITDPAGLPPEARPASPTPSPSK